MSVSIAGAGWVTPLGSDLSEVWTRLLNGEQAQAEKIGDATGNKNHSAFRIPDSALKNLPIHPRLRRASAISRFAAAAGLAALDNAKLTVDSNIARRMALVFAAANGGVIYTKRFYDDIVRSGAEAASPLLFPETVFNAAASHLAAIVGLTGTSYTVVGDGAVGLFAVKMAEDLLSDPNLDYCLVVAAEEADWLLCDAYQKWRLLRSGPPIEPFERPPRGTVLSEGAGALLLSRSGIVRIEAVETGAHFSRRTETAEALKRVLAQVSHPEATIVIGSANGTFIDEAEARATSDILPGAAIYTPKAAFGEGVGASALWQVIIALEALRRQELPRPQLNWRDSQAEKSAAPELTDCRRIVVLSCGLNQQVAAARLSI
jgi:3-oxoacyl-(acyl-carrier-protein) synthase